MPRILPVGLNDTFLWSEELGYGWHTRPPIDYSAGYFENYRKLDATPMGQRLTAVRLGLVSKFCHLNSIVDVGIGGGRFVKSSGGRGFDVCHQALHWLHKNDLFADPYQIGGVWAASCWDSLEHIPEPEKLLAQVKGWLFVSMPIYDGLQGVLQSKHYKPGEHVHYWTFDGFVKWCDSQGFELVEVNHAESELGREGITSFAFRRAQQ